MRTNNIKALAVWFCCNVEVFCFFFLFCCCCCCCWWFVFMMICYGHRMIISNSRYRLEKIEKYLNKSVSIQNRNSIPMKQKWHDFIWSFWECYAICNLAWFQQYENDEWWLQLNWPHRTNSIRFNSIPLCCTVDNILVYLF